MAKDSTLYFNAEHEQRVVEHEDGHLSFESANYTFQVDGDGNVKGDLRSIKSVGIKNIIDLQSYDLTRDEFGVTHAVSFGNRGTLNLSYGSDGSLREFNGQNLKLHISKDGEIMIESGQ